MTDKNLSLSATRKNNKLLHRFYNTLSAMRKFLRRRFSIVMKIAPKADYLVAVTQNK